MNQTIIHIHIRGEYIILFADTYSTDSENNLINKFKHLLSDEVNFEMSSYYEINYLSILN
jgi:hypothetical protein